MHVSKAKICIKQKNFFPVWPIEIARLTAVLVLPTPPLPLVTAIESVIINLTSILSVMESCFTMESRFSLRYCIKTFCDANIGASIIDFDAENKPIFASFVAREEKLSCSDVALIQFCKSNHRIKVFKFTHRQRNHV